MCAEGVGISKKNARSDSADKMLTLLKKKNAPEKSAPKKAKPQNKKSPKNARVKNKT